MSTLTDAEFAILTEKADKEMLGRWPLMDRSVVAVAPAVVAYYSLWAPPGELDTRSESLQQRAIHIVLTPHEVEIARDEDALLALMDGKASNACRAMQNNIAADGDLEGLVMHRWPSKPPLRGLA